MGYTSLNDLKQLIKKYTTDNPGIFILPDNERDSSKAFPPTCIFIDDEGDVIIQFNIEYLNEE